MNEVDHAIVHVSKYLYISDVLGLSSTCTTLYRFDELWMHFLFYLKQRLSSFERIYMNKISYTLFCRCKPTCIAFCLYQKMQRIPKYEHLNCLWTRKNILLFLVASVLKNGRECLYEYNTFIDETHICNRNKMSWISSSWEVLNGNRQNIFRRNFLPVY